MSHRRADLARADVAPAGVPRAADVAPTGFSRARTSPHCQSRLGRRDECEAGARCEDVPAVMLWLWYPGRFVLFFYPVGKFV